MARRVLGCPRHVGFLFLQDYAVLAAFELVLRLFFGRGLPPQRHWQPWRFVINRVVTVQALQWFELSLSVHVILIAWLTHRVSVGAAAQLEPIAMLVLRARWCVVLAHSINVDAFNLLLFFVRAIGLVVIAAVLTPRLLLALMSFSA